LDGSAEKLKKISEIRVLALIVQKVILTAIRLQLYLFLLRF